MNKTKLSVNINKVATLRNARGKNTPDLIHIAKIILKSKAHGITVHPRPDERHIRYTDILQLKKLIKNYPDKELNIEGYPSTTFLQLVQNTKPHQCTLVPDPPEAQTSNAGWDFVSNKNILKTAVHKLQLCNIRTSLFLDPMVMNENQYSALKSISSDGIEFYTESYAKSWNSSKQENILSQYKQSALKIIDLGLYLNAGHDLNQSNLFDLLKTIPELREVSIGQALIAEALEEGISTVIQKYLNIIDWACS